MYFLFYIDRVNISISAISIQSDLHLNNEQLGLVFSAFAYPYAFFQIVGGWFSDRFGSRRTLIVSGLLVAASTMATGAVAGLASLFLVRLMLGFGEGAAFPTATCAMASWLPASRWGAAQGLTHSAARLGNALTPPLIGALIVAFSWRFSFVAVGAVSLVWVAIWARQYHDQSAPTANVSQPVPWGALIRRIAPVTAVDFCYGWTLWLFLNWLPAFFQVTYQLDLMRSAVFSSGVFLAGIVGDTLGGIASDHLLRRTGRIRLARCGVIAFGLLASLVCLLPLLFTHDLTVVAGCLALAFLFNEFVVAPIWAVPMDIAPEHAGKASGLMNLGFGIAGVVSPIAVGTMIDATGNRVAPFVASIAVLLLGTLLALAVRPDLPLQSTPAGGDLAH